MNTTRDLLTLALLPAVPPLRARELLGRGPLVETLRDPLPHADLLGAAALGALRSGAARRAAESEIRKAGAMGVRIIGCDEPAYPTWLRLVHAPPPVLWARGSLREGEGERAVAVVGARAATGAGLSFARALARDLAAAGLTVVSGLARGVDTFAHRGALDAGGRTIAVLGSGLDRIYPPENGALARAIENDGAVVSEFALGTGPWKQNFPRRNRVIAGWGRAVVVIEAGARSGALSTARAALDEGRDVMAVPGHPSQPGSEGTNGLLRDGAALVRGAGDVLSELGMPAGARLPAERDTRGCDAGRTAADPVLSALPRGDAASIDEIQARCRIEVPALVARLAELEIGGEIARLGDGLFVRR
jgi:DNA processing protein